MKKIGIRLAVAVVTLCLTATCALAQTAPNTDEPSAAQSAAQAQEAAGEKAGTEETEQPAVETAGAAKADAAEAAAGAAEKEDTEEVAADATADDATDDDETASKDVDSTGETEDGTTDESEDETVQEAEAPVSPHAALREMLNAIELAPEFTGNEELDALVQGVLEEITTPEMDTYEQVKACYDYLTGNMRYSWSGGRYYTQVLDTTATALFRNYGKISGYGALALSTNSGQCNDYASAFILLTRAIGLEVNLANGRTISAGGGYIRHYWAEMEINGARYVFDPQLEQNLARYNKAPYYVFGKTYAQVGGRYVYYGATAI